jgi:hypothetical protein
VQLRLGGQLLGRFRLYLLAVLSISAHLTFSPLHVFSVSLNLSSLTALRVPAHVALLSQPVVSTRVGIPVTFSRPFICLVQLSSEHLVLAAQFFNLSAQVLGVRAKLVNLHLHSLYVEGENFLQFHAQLPGMPGEDLSKLNPQFL